MAVIMDHAPWHKGDDIKLLPYSPDLNPIEHAVKKATHLCHDFIENSTQQIKRMGKSKSD